MRNSVLMILVVVAVVLFLLSVMLIGTLSAPRYGEIIPLMTIAMQAVRFYFGLLIAVSAAIALLILAFRGESLERLLLLTLPLLAGLLIAEFHWALVLGIVALGVVWMVKEVTRIIAGTIGTRGA